ncbi:TRAP-type C4-dicarboxylate transport system, small permease component [Palleronia marisminoris]|uniref:TRAP transporter small permease protein n=1 Tax=Palleronia marisminoris TaxID=315423 RepID=A0A1Y5TN68_9RHOB|nr:TRAP transporter small permease [Palleronia marisminoris]SFH41441.1 TRAP-type C4-dicarboxylate transport system, small permease component [Palleronia marisminoris]SLN66067.1 Tripartite ATP-independent periplasmic transporters, DctQ component [Palleronia marisminoris]
MDRLNAISDRFFRLIAIVAGVGVLVMMVHICGDVILRTLTGRPLPATVEIVSRYYMLIVAFLPLAWVERQDGMISVEFIDGVMGAGTMRLSNAIVGLLSALIYVVLAWTSGEAALSQVANRSFVIVLNSRVPVWPGYLLLPAGFTLAAIAVLLKTATRVMARPVETRT